MGPPGSLALRPGAQHTWREKTTKNPITEAAYQIAAAKNPTTETKTPTAALKNLITSGIILGFTAPQPSLVQNIRAHGPPGPLAPGPTLVAKKKNNTPATNAITAPNNPIAAARIPTATNKNSMAQGNVFGQPGLVNQSCRQ